LKSNIIQKETEKRIKKKYEDHKTIGIDDLTSSDEEQLLLDKYKTIFGEDHAYKNFKESIKKRKEFNY
jgi:hypothetical protein